jgi:nitroreductase
MVIVNDSEVLRMIKVVSPGFFGDAQAAIVIYTDLEVAQEGLGKIGMDMTSRYDAGAAAENIVLAAYSLGLGACFIKSFSEVALRRILKLPKSCRPELVISLGYPSEDRPKPSRQREGAKTVWLNRYGERWT